MIIGTEVIVRKLEEKIGRVKQALALNDQKMLKEDVITIKAYCDLLLEVNPEETTILHSSKIIDNKVKSKIEPSSSDSLLDF